VNEKTRDFPLHESVFPQVKIFTSKSFFICSACDIANHHERFAKRKWYVAVLILLVPYFLRNDYGVFGVLLPLLFHWTRGQKKWVAFLFLSLLNTVYSGYIGIIYGVWWQLFAVMGIAIALWMPSIKTWRWKINKYAFYGFYPTHLALLWFLHVFVF
jgi:hypothetical protein